MDISLVHGHSQAYRTSRRKFSRLLVGLLVAAPGIASAQSIVVRRIGVLESGKPDTAEEIRKHDEPLRALGWVEGENLHVERRYANWRYETLQPLAEELVRAKVELIVTGGTAATSAAKRATTTTPIVFRVAADPLGTGLVASLARPGRNVTGFSGAAPEVTAKSLTILKELLPALRLIGVVASANPYFRPSHPEFERICRSLGLEPFSVQIGSAGDIGSAIAQLARQQPEALVLRGDAFMWNHRFEIVGAAMKYRLPTMSEQPDIVREAGALVSYSFTQAEEDRRRAYYIDRVLRGAKPGDLPVEQPTKFELVINLKTAKALGVTIPQPLLLRADEVIQ